MNLTHLPRQGHRLCPRLTQLGSPPIHQCRLEDVRVVDTTADRLRRGIPYLRVRMDERFSVRFPPPPSSPSSRADRPPYYRRIYVDNRLQFMIQLSFFEPFFTRGNFPPVVQNGTTPIVLENPWVNGTNATPFDQRTFPLQTGLRRAQN